MENELFPIMKKIIKDPRFKKCILLMCSIHSNKKVLLKIVIDYVKNQ